MGRSHFSASRAAPTNYRGHRWSGFRQRETFAQNVNPPQRVFGRMPRAGFSGTLHRLGAGRNRAPPEQRLGVAECSPATGALRHPDVCNRSRNSFTALSHKRSGLRSPALASSIILLAISSFAISPRSASAAFSALSSAIWILRE
jgi:hypothetical protein